MVHIDKLKRFERDAPECRLHVQTDGTGGVGFSDASAPISPVTAGGQTLPYMAKLDVENRTETVSSLADCRYLPDYGDAHRRTQEPTDGDNSCSNESTASSARRPPRRLNDFVRRINVNYGPSCAIIGEMTKVKRMIELAHPKH